MIKNAFYFILKSLFLFKMFRICPDFFGHVRKWLDKKAKVNFQIYDVATWEKSNYNTYIAQHLKIKAIRKRILVS